MVISVINYLLILKGFRLHGLVVVVWRFNLNFIIDLLLTRILMAFFDVLASRILLSVLERDIFFMI